MKLKYGTCTHPGRRRKANQDDLLIEPEENLFVVADGMGGHAAGELAAHLCVESVKRYYEETHGRPPATWPHPPEPGKDPYITRLVTAIQLAHQKILATMKTHPKLKGMGTTVVAAWFAADRIFIAHVGDSRCYRLRKGELAQLTRDHSLVNALRERFELSPAQEAQAAHMTHILVRALGVEDDAYADVDIAVLTPEDGDTFLLCSDGLTDEVQDPDLQSILGSEDTPGRAAAHMIRRANDSGGRDNITAIVVEYRATFMDAEETLLDDETVDMTSEWFEEPEDTKET
ncbi:MAG: PP2C family serine/threonine-protein phosphatase [Pseudomonadota bacterium]